MMPPGSQNMDFKCALVTGGGGGIGKAMSQYFISQGKQVIIAGRTESNLKATAKEIGVTAYYVLDTGRVADIQSFVGKITKEHPEIDCLVNNAGVQRPLEVLKQDPDEFLQKADQEIDINIRGPMHLALAFLKHFKAKEHSMIINVSSVLGFVPFSVINPVYNGTKAWLHFWSLAISRTQLRGTSVRIVEIAPPAVGTDLHRDRDDPDDNKKHKNPDALSIEEFIDEISKKLERGDEMITAGIGNAIVDKWDETMGAKYAEMTEAS
ncbi:hypothetical protein PFICI_03486 [Pestalotiopsis fici W106-1]|uniref:Uncharacterized protein n=1 Tax=Pestalotiopsis fici (strain W106-1 / CGMCC3.15140) TaxID=1229662 RepID=W3XJM9_PESFW|nr:uncharacterized protein PFICI_03486 [Pestalotiopsis fici W106-1]ETS85461.1 hypothetical protein PFICI_03486 [Pestalotiopsis fici W106-1]